MSTNLIWHLAGAEWIPVAECVNYVGDGCSGSFHGYGYGNCYGDGLYYGFLDGSNVGYGYRGYAKSDYGDACGYGFFN